MELSSIVNYFQKSTTPVNSNTLPYDRTLLSMIIIVALIGLVMVLSASVTANSDPFYYAKRDLAYLTVSILCATIVLQIPMAKWQQYSPIILIISIVMLIMVLLVGRTINGATRWIGAGIINIQPAEIAKLTLFIYLASYLVRKVDEVRNNVWGFCKPMGVMLILAILLLLQPDFGTVVVLFVTTLGLLFLAGAKLWQFLAIISMGALAVIVLILTEEYRIKRVISFMDPWKDPFGAGYQLAQSLIAFGRGGLWGEGLGNSIQKQQFLPEAHTDFIFAIIAEELGYVGVVILLLMIFFIAFRAMSIGYKALKLKHRFSGFLACAIGIWFSFQTLVNVGATSGILPTKGLTFPLLSYGGSSMIVVFIAVAMLLRIDFETRLTMIQAHIWSKK